MLKKMTTSDGGIIEFLERFYSNYCDGDWEHQHGIKIVTLDNPGWSVTIDLAETEQASKNFRSISISRSDDDWTECWVKDCQWQGRGGRANLREILEAFIGWSKSLEDF